MTQNKQIEIKMEVTDNETPEACCEESGGDNLEDIKKYIETDQESDASNANKNLEKTCKDELKDTDGKDFDERLEVASSMMDEIMNETDERLAKKKEGASTFKNQLNAGEKGNTSMALSVGSEVEVKDFAEYWHPAKIIEVDYEEMEVLVRYEFALKKHDEWISVSSPRLRPLTNMAQSAPQSELKPTVTHVPVRTESNIEKIKEVKEEPKVSTDDKPKLQFVAGERCLAKWRDNRRFTATINSDLGDGRYEVVFDDGFKWTCPTSRLYKMKLSGKTDGLTIDTSTSIATSVASPVQYGAGPSSALPAAPAYHTHLFDPTRDYLGSKSERREMKRKLNIKEIFNIGQKKYKKNENKERVQRSKSLAEKKKKEVANEVKYPLVTPKTEIPDAVASIIGTIKDENDNQDLKENTQDSVKDVVTKTEELKQLHEVKYDVKEDMDNKLEVKVKDELDVETKDGDEENADLISIEDLNIGTPNRGSPFLDPVPDEELLLEKFDQDDKSKHEEVIDKIKEVINKLEDGISRVESPKIEIREDTEPAKGTKTEPETKPVVLDAEKSKKVSKVKKSKKLRLLQEKKVKKQVEKVKSELEEMKRQVEEMRKQMVAKTEELAKGPQEMPESFLLPGEWCCRWVNGQPVGRVCELEGEVRNGNSKLGLPRRSVQVEDKRLPPGWTKHMVRRSLGHSAGKWDVVLVNPENRRFHTKTDMRNYMEQNPNDPIVQAYEHVLLDFGVHLKLARRMGWVSTTPGGVDNTPVTTLPAGTLCSTSPLVKRRKLGLKKENKHKTINKDKLSLKIRIPKYLKKKHTHRAQEITEYAPSIPSADLDLNIPHVEDGYVYVGSLKVQIIENLLRCPAEGCYKNFRNNTLIKMHIKHYHRELRKMLGRTPKVLDLAYARTMPILNEPVKMKEADLKTIKVKIPRPPKRVEEPKKLKEVEVKEPKIEIDDVLERPTTPIDFAQSLPKMQDSPKLRHALINKPVKRPRVLLPVRRPEPELDQVPTEVDIPPEFVPSPAMDSQPEQSDFEKSLSPQRVTQPVEIMKKKEKKHKIAMLPKKSISEDEDWYTLTSDVETRSSFPRSGTPDSKNMDHKLPLMSSESNEDQKMSKNYMYTESGERIKIVHMKREEIINCHCGFREEDGLMVQCELCLCWQHAMCHNIQKESEVPEKYTCSICLNPRRGRRSARFVHDQDRMYEGLLPGARASEPLRRSHELSGNLHRIQDALHALRVKYFVAMKKDHPKLYLWAKDWENGELNLTQERLNSDYSDLNIMINSIGKENLPVKTEDLNPHLDIQTPPSEEHDRYNQRECQLGSQSLLSGLLSSPGGASLELPISTSELERLAKTVQEEVQRVSAPQPEAAIENGACRERLLRHIQRCQAVIDARLDSIEAQVAELESQDPSFEDDETADYFPRTKQTIQMLMRDLDTMEELGVIT